MLAPIFAVTTWSYDGIIEAIERKDCPSQWGVQCHPERQRIVDPAWTKVFRKLVKDAKAWRANPPPQALPNAKGDLAVLDAEEAERRGALLRIQGNFVPGATVAI